MDANKAEIQQVVRILMYFGSGLLAKAGLDTQDELTMVAGALTGVVALGWWFIWNRKR